MFANEPTDRQHQIVARAWQAIGIKLADMPDDAVDELMAEWLTGLQPLELDEIAIGVKECQRRKCTAPIDEFVALCKPQPTKPPQLDAFNETKRESWEKLGLSKTRGPLPEGRG